MLSSCASGFRDALPKSSPRTQTSLVLVVLGPPVWAMNYQPKIWGDEFELYFPFFDWEQFFDSTFGPEL